MTKRNQSVIDFMKTRRSVPSKILGGPGPSQAEITEILQIATRVPDHGKLAPWRFVQFSNAAKQRLNAKIYARAIELDPGLASEQQAIEKSRFPQNHTVLAMFSTPKSHPKVPVWEQELSAGACAMNLLIGANAIGYDAQWYTGWYAFDENLQEAWGIGEGERIVGFFHLGQKTMPKSERARPDIEDIYTVIKQ